MLNHKPTKSNWHTKKYIKVKRNRKNITGGTWTVAIQVAAKHTTRSATEAVGNLRT